MHRTLPEVSVGYSLSSTSQIGSSELATSLSRIIPTLSSDAFLNEVDTIDDPIGGNFGPGQFNRGGVNVH
jgi:hypothetical protein